MLKWFCSFRVHTARQLDVSVYYDLSNQSRYCHTSSKSLSIIHHQPLSDLPQYIPFRTVLGLYHTVKSHFYSKAQVWIIFIRSNEHIFANFYTRRLTSAGR